MLQSQVTANLQLLRARRASLFEREQTKLHDALVSVAQVTRDDNGNRDQASEIAEQAVALILTGLEAGALARIDAALLRAKEGRYGVCEDCGGEIAADRLAHVPEAARCVVCEDELERERASRLM